MILQFILCVKCTDHYFLCLSSNVLFLYCMLLFSFIESLFTEQAAGRLAGIVHVNRKVN